MGCKIFGIEIIFYLFLEFGIMYGIGWYLINKRVELIKKINI